MQAPMDVFGWFELPRVFVAPADDETGRALAWYLHIGCGWILIGLTLGHVVAAIWHPKARGSGLRGRPAP